MLRYTEHWDGWAERTNGPKYSVSNKSTCLCSSVERDWLLN